MDLFILQKWNQFCNLQANLPCIKYEIPQFSLKMMKSWLIDFPRLNQLYEAIGPVKQNNVLAAYIQQGRFEPKLQREHARLLENNLVKLDPNGWQCLLEKIKGNSCNKQEDRGWQQFWDILNEVRGYVWLADHGYSKIYFIPCKKNKKTAELIGESGKSRAMVEVKTINRSDDDFKRSDPTFLKMKSGRAGCIQDLQAFVNKLRDKSDQVSAFLWETLDNQARDLLASDLNKPSSAQLVDCDLVRHLNLVINGPLIYVHERFINVRLRSLTRELTRDYMKDISQHTKFSFLNRLLLEDAYDNELTKLPSLCVSMHPNMSIPDKLRRKLEGTVNKAFDQITETMRYELPVDKKIILLVINKDFECSPISLKQLETELSRQDCQVVCQNGDCFN